MSARAPTNTTSLTRPLSMEWEIKLSRKVWCGWCVCFLNCQKSNAIYFLLMVSYWHEACKAKYFLNSINIRGGGFAIPTTYLTKKLYLFKKSIFTIPLGNRSIVSSCINFWPRATLKVLQSWKFFFILWLYSKFLYIALMAWLLKLSHLMFLAWLTNWAD